jgi:hypothetical protein
MQEAEVPKLVQTFQPLCVMEIPVSSPKAISFECLDTRLLKAYRKISREVGFKRGELYPNKTAGAVNNLLDSNENIKLNSHKTIEMLIANGVDTVILSAHTDCAGDKAIRGALPYEEDRAYQLDKLRKAYEKISAYSKVKRLSLKVRCFLLDVVGLEVTIIEVNHRMSDDVNHQEEIEKFGNLVGNAARSH